MQYNCLFCCNASQGRKSLPVPIAVVHQTIGSMRCYQTFTEKKKKNLVVKDPETLDDMKKNRFLYSTIHQDI